MINMVGASGLIHKLVKLRKSVNFFVIKGLGIFNFAELEFNLLIIGFVNKLRRALVLSANFLKVHEFRGTLTDMSY